VRSAIVFGAGGGIGGAVAERLAASGEFDVVHAAARSAALPETPRLHGLRVDLTDEDSLRAAAEAVGDTVDLVIVATGILHDAQRGILPEKSYRAIEARAFAEVLQINTIGPAMIARHFLPKLPRARRGVFLALSARVGSIGDNGLGGWHAYRASKAALNMLVAGFAIEMRRTHPQAIVAAYHPGTVATRLSRPFRGPNGPGRIVTPDEAAADLLSVLSGLSVEDSGGFFGWDASRLPW